MIFYKTNNVSYEMVYSSETEKEYMGMYDMLPEINNLALKRNKLQDQLATAIAMLKEFQTTDCSQTWVAEMNSSIEAFISEVEGE